MTWEERLQRVSTNRNVRGGMACIKGARIPIAIIIDLFGGGSTEVEILDAYPTLAQDDVRAAYACSGKRL
jgi:uncharacterized protein (DUF433 family)